MGYSGPVANYRPHRGAIVLTLGILGIVMSTVAAAILPCTPIIGLALSIPAWFMGSADLKAIDRGEMDPQGRGPTMAGMITGIVGTVIGGIAVVIALVFIALFFGLIAFGAAAGNMK